MKPGRALWVEPGEFQTARLTLAPRDALSDAVWSTEMESMAPDLRFARSIHGPCSFGFIWRRLPGCLDIVVVPIVGADRELNIGFRRGYCGRRGRIDEAFD